MFEVSRRAGPVGVTAARSAKPSGLLNFANLADFANLAESAGLPRRSNLTGLSRLDGLSGLACLSRRSNPGVLAVLSNLSDLGDFSNPTGLADLKGLAARSGPWMRSRRSGRPRRTWRWPVAFESFAGGELRPRPEPGVRRTYLARAMYSRVSVLIVMVSPSWTKCGTCTVSPVSIVAGLSVLVTAADLIPGSVCTTLRLTVLGSETLSGVVS